jgi:drug/metabolite transporter (DMT)-like permease
MTPLFTIIIAAIAFRKRHSRDTYFSLVPVVAGVVFATYGDYSFTAWGFILTLLGTLLAALKTIVTNRAFSVLQM